MSTNSTVILIVIVVVALLVVGLLVVSMRKKSREDDIARADQIRRDADERASVLAAEQARAKEVEAQAEQARIQAEQAEQRAQEAGQRAQEARTGVAQEEARHEDHIRAADRLDPTVDETADDYTPGGAHTAATTQGEETQGEETRTETDEAAPETTDDTRQELPRRTRGAQEMPGHAEEGDGSGSLFKRKEPPAEQ